MNKNKCTKTKELKERKNTPLPPRRKKNKQQKDPYPPSQKINLQMHVNEVFSHCS